MEKPDGEKVVLRRSAIHPGDPSITTDLEQFKVEKKKPALGSLKFFCDVSQFSANLKHS